MTTHANGVTRAITYGRVSTTEQHDSGLSLDHQAATMSAECARRGLVIVDEAIDVASGKSLNRPALARALDLLKRHEADVLVTCRIDRLSRSTLDFAGLIDRSRREGWAVIALDLGVDMLTPSGELMATVVSAMAQYERALIGQRTREALAVKRAQGARLGRPRTMPAELLGKIVGMSADGLGPTAIARALNHEGIAPARGGSQWYPSTVAKALRGHALDREALALSGAS